MTLALLAAFGLGLAVGASLLVLATHALRDRRGVWEEAEEEAGGHGAPEPTWGLRIAPSRYLARFPEGPYAEQARRLVRDR